MIRFLFLKVKSRSEIKEHLDAVYGNSSPSMTTVKNWFNEFQRGRTSVFDEPRPGAPKTATTEDNVTKIHDLVSQNDHRALLCRIIGPIRRRIAEKTAPFGEEKKSSSTMTTHRLTPSPQCCQRKIFLRTRWRHRIVLEFELSY